MINADDSQLIKGLSPGKILLQARLQVGLTQEQVAKELYMTVYKVKALEADDYNRLSSDTFARGYIRAYANLVKIDVVVVLTAFDVLMDRLKPKETAQKQAHVVTENGHRGAWQFLAVIGVFFIALWLISVWFFDNHTDEQYAVAVVANSSASSTKALAVDVNSLSVPSEISKSDALVLTSSLGSSGSSSVSPVAALSTQALASTATVSSVAVSRVLNAASSVATIESTNLISQSSSSAKKTSLDELSFSFREESWLEVSDSRGDVLATELQPARSKLNLVGIAPFDVKLGNAPAVDIILNGKKMDVVPLMGSKVLTLKIDN